MLSISSHSSSANYYLFYPPLYYIPISLNIFSTSSYFYSSPYSNFSSFPFFFFFFFFFFFYSPYALSLFSVSNAENEFLFAGLVTYYYSDESSPPNPSNIFTVFLAGLTSSYSSSSSY